MFQWELRFAPNSLFPDIKLSSIYEMEFYLSYYLHINNFDNMSYFEFLWKYERLVIEKEKTKEKNSGIPLQNLIRE